MAIKLIVCGVCGFEFSGYANALYCSNKCRQENHRATANKKGYIYKLIKNGEVVYVGQSRVESGVESRITAHKTGEGKKDFDSYECYKVDGESLNEVEAREIMESIPKYNGNLPRNHSYKPVKSIRNSMFSIIDSIIIGVSDTYTITNKSGDETIYVKASDIDDIRLRMIDSLKQANIISEAQYLMMINKINGDK